MAENEVKQQNNFKHIVRVANVDIPGKKAVRISLTKIKGIGQQFADVLCVLAKVDKNKVTGYLDEKEVIQLTTVINDPEKAGMPIWMLNRRKDYDTGVDKHLVSATLNFTKDNDLKRLRKIKTLRGVRHGKNLPVRGQRTKSNFRRSKGKVVGVKRKGKK